eukprot:scaffold100291_cov18-Tisochrysis_lutea.AAC.1
MPLTLAHLHVQACPGWDRAHRCMPAPPPQTAQPLTASQLKRFMAGQAECLHRPLDGGGASSASAQERSAPGSAEAVTLLESCTVLPREPLGRGKQAMCPFHHNWMDSKAAAALTSPPAAPHTAPHTATPLSCAPLSPTSMFSAPLAHHELPLTPSQLQPCKSTAAEQHFSLVPHSRALAIPSATAAPARVLHSCPSVPPSCSPTTTSATAAPAPAPAPALLGSQSSRDSAVTNTHDSVKGSSPLVCAPSTSTPYKGGITPLRTPHECLHASTAEHHTSVHASTHSPYAQPSPSAPAVPSAATATATGIESPC